MGKINGMAYLDVIRQGDILHLDAEIMALVNLLDHPVSSRDNTYS
jgi:hypothetical protein